MNRLRGPIALVAILVAVPLAGLLIAFPLWYASTNFRLLYTLGFVVFIAVRIALRVLRPDRTRG